MILWFLSFSLVSCGKAVPPLTPNVSGVTDGAVYGAAVFIDVRDPEDKVSYTATMDGQPFEPGSLFGEDGRHTLTVTATGRKELTSQTTVEFEIDKVPPPAPEVTGVEKGKTYNSSVCPYVYERDGITYTASIDGKEYSLGSEYEEEGKHELKVYALKERNGLTTVTAIPFVIDRESFTSDEIAYFREIAFGSEYGGKSENIRKWRENILVGVEGSATEEDRESLSRVVSELNEIIGSPQVRILDNWADADRPVQTPENGDSGTGKSEQPNLQVYFIPHAEFEDHTSKQIAQDNWGLFFYYEDTEGVINRAKVLIASDKANAKERAHLIREEFTQALGLAQDSGKYPGSIFYQGWTTVQNYSEIDKKLISMLYDKEIAPNMPEKEALNYFEGKHADRNERYQVFPEDQSSENPSFTLFAGELRKNILHRDIDGILHHVAEDFTAEPLEGKGIELFKKYFMLESVPEQTTLWKSLGGALELGGVFIDHGLSVYEAPYTQARFPKELDPNTCKVALGADVKARRYPDASSPVVGTLRFDAVQILPPLPPSELPEGIDREEMSRWERIGTFDGKTGYAPVDDLRSPCSDIFTFRKKDGQWLISAVSNR
jgi:hypothetical protein